MNFIKIFYYFYNYCTNSNNLNNENLNNENLNNENLNNENLNKKKLKISKYLFNNNYFYKYLFIKNKEYYIYSLNKAVEKHAIIHKNIIINKSKYINKNIYLYNNSIYKLSNYFDKKIYIYIIRYLYNNKVPNIILPNELYEELNDNNLSFDNKLILQKFEYKKYGDLFNYVENNLLNYNKVYIIYYKLVKIIRNLHILNISHRDIKLENILIDYKPYLDLYLIDFEYANYNCDYKKFNGGTVNYAAPELLNRDYKINNYNCVDIWALGIILYILLFKHLPWTVADIYECNHYNMYILDSSIIYKKVFELNIPICHKIIYNKIFKYCFNINYENRIDINKIFNLL